MSDSKHIVTRTIARNVEENKIVLKAIEEEVYKGIPPERARQIKEWADSQHNKYLNTWGEQ